MATGFSAVGLANGENIGAVTITAAGGMAANAPLGPYTLMPSLAVGGSFNPNNYTITYYPGTLTVLAAPLTITAINDSKSYGQNRSYGAGSVAFNSSGLASGDVVTSVTITAPVGAAATAPVGTYALTPSAAIGTFDPHNYTINYVPGVLSVTPIPLTITANSDSKVYGQLRSYGAGSNAFTTSALVNGEAVTSVTLTATGGAAQNSPVGNYQLLPSQAAGLGTFAVTNYTITYLPGTLTVTPTTLTITASNQTKTYGQITGFGAGSTAFASNGLVAGDVISSVTITASSGGTANAPVGRYTITPSAPVGPSFLAGNYLITYYSGTLTVTTAQLTITATSDAKTYGQIRTYGTVSSGFSATGLASNETIGTVTITASGGAAANAPLGTYTLTPSAASGGTFNPANYLINYATGTLTVGPAALTITANNATKYYGQPYHLPVPTYTVTGLVAGDTIGTVTITPSGGTAMDAPVGSYTLMPSAAAAPANGTFVATNYTITYAGGTLTVSAPLLQITAANDTKAFGTIKTYGPGSTAFTSTGLVNGETVGTVTITASGGTTQTAPAGVYYLVPSLAIGGSFNPTNYTIQYIAGTLTVGKGSSATLLTTSAATVLFNTSVTFTAAVSSSTAGIPTGAVTFKDGTTSIGSATLDATGTATLAISTLTSGTHSITAVYAGDATFATSTSNVVSQTVQDFQFIVNGANVNGATTPVLAQTVTKGQAATYQFQVSPSPNTTFPNMITLSMTGLPAGATYTMSPSTLAAGSGTQTITVVVQTSATSSALQPQDKGAPGGVMLGLLLPALGLLRLRRGGRRFKRMVLLGLLLIALFAIGLVGCGGGSTQGFYGSTTKTYTMQFVATSGSVQHFTTVGITVN